MTAMSRARIAGWRSATVAAVSVGLFCAVAPVVGEAQGPGVPASDPRRARYQEQEDVHRYTAALAGMRHDVSVGITVPRRFLNEPETKSFKLHAEVRDRIPDEVRQEGLTNSNESNHRRLYGAVQAAVNRAKQELERVMRAPHVTIAGIADDVLVGRFVGGGTRFCKRFGPDRLRALGRKIDDARKANRVASSLGDDVRGFTGTEANLTRRDPAPTPPPMTRPTPPKGPPSLVGPPPLAHLPERPAIPATCYENQCWPNAQAVDHDLRTGEWIEPRPRSYPLAEELSDLPSPRRLITEDLRKKHGGPNALDPLHAVLSRGQFVDIAGRADGVLRPRDPRGSGAQGQRRSEPLEDREEHLALPIAVSRLEIPS